MTKNKKYWVATAIGVFAAIALINAYVKESVPYAPARTTAEELAQLANYTRIRVAGDFVLEITQVQDYRIEYVPLSSTQGELEARVEDDTLLVSGFGNRTDAGAAVLRIGIPVLDTLEVDDVPQITVSDFTAPLMNVRLLSFSTFTFQNNVLGIFNLESRGPGIVNLRNNMLTTPNIQAEGSVNITSD